MVDICSEQYLDDEHNIQADYEDDEDDFVDESYEQEGNIDENGEYIEESGGEAEDSDGGNYVEGHHGEGEDSSSDDEGGHDRSHTHGVNHTQKPNHAHHQGSGKKQQQHTSPHQQQQQRGGRKSISSSIDAQQNKPKRVSSTTTTEIDQTTNNVIKKKKITYRLGSSLAQLAKEEKNSAINVKMNSLGSPSINGSSSGNGTTNDTVKKFKLEKIFLTDVNNEFPCSIAISISGPALKFVQNEIADNGSQCQFVAHPKVQLNNQYIELTDSIANNSDNDGGVDILKQYPGFNSSNLNTGVIQLDEVSLLISKSNPVLKTIAEYKKRTKDNQPFKKFDDDKHIVVTETYRECSKIVKEKFVNSERKRSNLKDISLNLTRAFYTNNNSTSISTGISDIKEKATSKWLDPVEIFDRVSSDAGKDARRSEKYNMYVTLEVHYVQV